MLYEWWSESGVLCSCVTVCVCFSLCHNILKISQEFFDLVSELIQITFNGILLILLLALKGSGEQAECLVLKYKVGMMLKK